MCGIVALFGEEREVPVELLTHRGPDDYRTKKMGKCRMDFYRLAINDLTDAGMQPFVRTHTECLCVMVKSTTTVHLEMVMKRVKVIVRS
jgi:asparagine synthase (glutamine-hydrolysing)